MPAKPENTFISAVHRRLPSPDDLHREKMHNPYRSGTADVWYSGRLDLWVEYKFIQVPVRETSTILLCGAKNPLLSPLQQDWLSRREAEGRRVWVVVGCAKGGVVLKSEAEWRRVWTAKEFKSALISCQAVAQEILNCVEPP